MGFVLMTFDTKQKSSNNKGQIMPSKKKKYNARFPAGRIKKIMQTDEEVGKVAQAVPVIISRTLELFVESLLKKSMQITLSRNAKTLTPSHMKQCILSESRFDFLKDLVKDIPDASVQEDNENDAIFEDSSSQNEADAESSAAPMPVPSHSRKKHSSAEGGSRETPIHKIDLTGCNQPKKRKLHTSTEVSSTITSPNSSSSYPVPSSPHLLSPSPTTSTATVTAANFYKDHHQQQEPQPQQSTSTARSPVIQYGPTITHQNPNTPLDGSATQASQLTFSMSNLLNRNVIHSEEPNLRITIASEHLPPPPLAMSSSSSATATPPRLVPSDNVPPLVPLRMQGLSIASTSMQIPAQKYVLQTPGDLNIDEDYDN